MTSSAIFADDAHLSGGQGGAAGADGGIDARLLHTDDIHVALAQDQVIFPGGSGYIQSVQITALVKKYGSLANSGTWLAVSHHSPAKSNHPVIDIHDWKNNTIPEFVIHALAFIHIEKAGFPKKFITVILGFRYLYRSSLYLSRIPQTEFPDRLFAETSACKIIVGIFSTFTAQLVIKILSRFLIDFKQGCALLRFRPCLLGIFDLGKFHTGTLCQMGKCFSK